MSQLFKMFLESIDILNRQGYTVSFSKKGDFYSVSVHNENLCFSAEGETIPLAFNFCVEAMATYFVEEVRKMEKLLAGV